MSGPSGIVECFTVYGGKYQWGTCLTKAYIEQRFKRNHTCRDRTNTYCYYQCMLEQYGISEVYDVCSCQTDEAPLPAWCYSPDGRDCSWYKACLETSYALEYGENFCNLYTENYNGFDETGRKWIDAVRKCLQVALVPLLRRNNPSCDEIKDVAFRSHSEC
ncbi:LOW QUALITY PROTEIN: hypothetical protein MAR_034463, partial [Mya arenaria]